ncbi:hypothetical protein Rsub_01160 [Raphidocelis subcapitata]|uniref:Plant synaptotagmin n=1 Tax=Raphidocelis subcapitata TaxID=307507 RepID=A0A2V0NU44_9CHLO|nr:hypothetical protein Rsub_01160 [Raphidocelis subcapitata]|eukprot:GBF88447.1 hypothetical protein Rsub_01160 [Raphidocelis subcapitata]
MVFGPVIGAAFGAVGGAALGAAVFAGDLPKSYKLITEAADRDDNIRTPAVAAISDNMRKLLPLTPEWTKWPDYDRWMMVNRVVRGMWPHLTGAILDEVVKAVKPILQGVMADLPPFIEDITLGPHSLLDAEHHDALFQGRAFSLGSFPIRVAGMKVYTTSEDSCIMEMPVMWGSNAAIDLQVYLKLGPLRLVVPVSVSDIQYKLLLRITLALVDTIPCIGGATVSLLELPHIDYKLRVLGGIDLMSLPGVKNAFRWTIQYVMKQLLLYPNSISVPLMANFGAPSEPLGMLHVRLHRIEGFKTSDMVGRGDPYVTFMVRQGREHSSRVVKNCKDPVYNEEFYLVVEDLKEQMLTIKVFDSDLGPTDELAGEMQLYFTHEEVETDEATGGQALAYKPRACVACPMTEEHISLPITPPPGQLLAGLGVLGSAVTTVGGAVGGALRFGREEEEEGPQKVTLKVATKFAEVRKKQEASCGAAAIAPRQTVTDGGATWEEMTEDAARIVAVKQIVAAEAEEEKKRLAKARAWLFWGGGAFCLGRGPLRLENGAFGIVLIDQEVELRGNTPPAEHALKRAEAKGAKAKTKGTLFITLTYMPFNKPEFDDDVEMAPAKSGLAAFVPFEPPRAREIAANASDFQKGLLTVKIIQAKGLAATSNLAGTTNPYVELLLVDCDKLRCDERKTSRAIYNDTSPRWNDKFDFVMVSAGSMLTLNVWDKTSALEMATSFKLSKARFQDRLVGRVTIPVSDVVRNGHLKDSFALQDAESGTLEMKLEWANCYVDDYVD